MSLKAGTQIGAYTVSGEVGRGGMGVVYRAIDTRLDRGVAMKALPEELAADAGLPGESAIVGSLYTVPGPTGN